MAARLVQRPWIRYTSSRPANLTHLPMPNTSYDALNIYNALASSNTGPHDHAVQVNEKQW